MVTSARKYSLTLPTTAVMRPAENRTYKPIRCRVVSDSLAVSDIGSTDAYISEKTDATAPSIMGTRSLPQVNFLE
jgi:hypothetical protein